MIKITFNDLAGMGFASVTDYCRHLMETEKDKENMEVQVFRGDMLCLTVSSVKYGASVEPDPTAGEWRPVRANRARRKPVGAFKDNLGTEIAKQ